MGKTDHIEAMARAVANTPGEYDKGLCGGEFANKYADWIEAGEHLK